ncbi:MAG: RDD family protein [Eubacteriales bacterium]
MFDLQKASIHKRVAAYILDLILLLIIVTGVAFALSSALNYDSYAAKLESIYDEYESRYGIDLDIPQEDFMKLSKEEQAVYEEVGRLLSENEEAIMAYNMSVNLAMLIASLSIVSAYLILEFIVPLCLKNGQTIGKKIFGIALVRQDGVRVTHLQMFIRSILGKCTFETLLPVYILILIIFGSLGMTGTVILVGFAILQLALTATSRTHSAIHDLMAVTVAVDFGSQMIFDKPEDLIAYKNKLHAENAANDKYIP